MAWYNNLFTKKAKLPKAKITTDNRALLQLMNGLGITTNQEARDRDYVERGYQLNPTVQSIINQTQKAAGMVKWGIYKKDKFGNKEPFRNRLLEELMYRPNTWMTWNDMVNELIGFYMIQGDMYLWGLYPEGTSLNSDKYAILRPLPSQHVQIHADRDGFGGVAGYSVDYYSNGSQVELPVQDVLHIKNFNPEYDEDASFLYGQSPLRSCRRSLEINNQAIDTGLAYLQNQGIRGILFREYDENLDFSEEQVRSLDSRFNQQHAGSRNANRVAAVEGKMGYVDLMTKTSDIELLKQYERSTIDICNAYGFPPTLLGVGKDTYQNVNESKKKLWNDVVIPMISMLRDGLNCWLAPQYGDNICIDFDLTNIKPIQEDHIKSGEAVQKYAGLVTINEARKLAGLPPVDKLGELDGNSLYVGFVQAVVSDSEEISEVNDEPTEETE